jgi:hypothetical protein
MGRVSGILSAMFDYNPPRAWFYSLPSEGIDQDG